MHGQMVFAKRLMFTGTAVAIGLGLLLAFLITRGITRPVNHTISRLNEASSKVSTSSGQLTAASQQLAEGASQQAAGLEEASASMEEMASMTKQNAGHAGEADRLMQQANRVVEKASTSMTALTRSIQEISHASAEISKIIKSIDEIAFQTNLLALNAAVEAARAGEAGAGFAVVADEVRNLAIRAAASAGDTARLIEGTVRRIDEGSGLVEDANQAFAEVVTAAGRVGELISEIAAASAGQADGITQINHVIAEMDRVVQQNAATAEESASASEELTAQAAEMTVMVDDLDVLVKGRARKGVPTADLPGAARLPLPQTARAEGDRSTQRKA
jgi:methyl-accepting chemotaxis protein